VKTVADFSATVVPELIPSGRDFVSFVRPGARAGAEVEQACPDSVAGWLPER
jgi:hypothetical protein